MMVQSVLIFSEDIVHTLLGHHFVMKHALIGIIDDLSLCGILYMRVLRPILAHFLSFKPQS